MLLEHKITPTEEIKSFVIVTFCLPVFRKAFFITKITKVTMTLRSAEGTSSQNYSS